MTVLFSGRERAAAALALALVLSVGAEARAQASAFAALVPVTPIEPMLSGLSCGSALFPACVSATGIPCLEANSATASVAFE